MADRPETALPAPRQVLAEIIRSIASTPAKTISTTTASAGTRDDYRPLLATLHILFPSLVLPALDLLDRRRVVRWGGPKAHKARRHLSSTSSSLSQQPSLYQIRGGGDQPHVVHLRAWHCTCAFFALQTAASTVLTPKKTEATDKEEQTQQLKLKEALSHLPLAFSTPPCKHLLACLLAEEWPPLDAYVITGEHDVPDTTDEGVCSPETLAGIVAGVL